MSEQQGRSGVCWGIVGSEGRMGLRLQRRKPPHRKEQASGLPCTVTHAR